MGQKIMTWNDSSVSCLVLATIPYASPSHPLFSRWRIQAQVYCYAARSMIYVQQQASAQKCRGPCLRNLDAWPPCY